MAEATDVAKAADASLLDRHPMRDENGGIRHEFVGEITRAVQADDAAFLRAIVGELHEADLGDLIEALEPDDRVSLVELTGADFDFSALNEVDDSVREEILEELEPETVAEGVRELESDDAVELHEGLDEKDKAEILEKLPPPGRDARPAQTPPSSPPQAAPQKPKAQEAIVKPAAAATPAPAAEAQPQPASEAAKPLAATAGIPAVDVKDVKPAMPAAKPAAIEPQASLPVLMGTPLPAPVPVSAKTVSAPLGNAVAMTAIEERVVELLRPMIREWLDNNMPRMIERALSIELASSVKPKSPMAKN